jgi:NAD(P)-dependent dehydrogenase (short-subunit alcohol dehydrogenase family)
MRVLESLFRNLGLKSSKARTAKAEFSQPLFSSEDESERGGSDVAIWNFDNQVAIITGGAGGLGHHLIQAFLDAGAVVYVSDQNELTIQQLQHDYCGEPKFRADIVDVTSSYQVKAWVDSIMAETNRVDIAINAAGICPLDPIGEIREALWDLVMQVNLKGPFLVSQAVAPLMKEQGYGRIVNISSIAGHTGGAAASAPYAASKAGVVSLTKSFANYLSPFGVTVNAVAPGPFETTMIEGFPEETLQRMVASTPTRRVGKNEDVVHTVLFLCDKHASHITGATVDVNGGLYMR